MIAAAEAQADREAFDRSRVDMMRAYAELHGACRREFLLSYFGEATDGPCGNCDLCDAGRRRRPADDAPFAVGAPRRHPKWGEGPCSATRTDKLVLLFDSVGYKALVPRRSPPTCWARVKRLAARRALAALALAPPAASANVLVIGLDGTRWDKLQEVIAEPAGRRTSRG